MYGTSDARTVAILFLIVLALAIAVCVASPRVTRVVPTPTVTMQGTP